MPFRLRIAAPQPGVDTEFRCEVSCSFLRDKPYTIFGVDEAQAFELAVRFVHRMLEGRDITFVDAAGNAISLPEPPPA